MRQHPAAPSSSPKHTIYSFILYSQIYAIFAICKEEEINKKSRVMPIYQKTYTYNTAKGNNVNDVFFYSRIFISVTWVDQF